MRDENEPEEPEDDDVYFLTCDVCGTEEDEEVAEVSWLSLAKMGSIEVLVCDDCAASEEKLQEGFGLFSAGLALARREEMT